MVVCSITFKEKLSYKIKLDKERLQVTMSNCQQDYGWLPVTLSDYKLD